MKSYQLNSSKVLQLKHRLWKLRFHVFPALKRMMDVSASALLMMLLSPLLIVIAALIKLDSKGTVFFKQERIGLSGLPFTMYKFRSMYSDAEARRKELEADNEMEQGVIFKIKCDPRITRIGTFIRKTSIDELPQLLNVFRGDMSLVGPRPPLGCEVEQYKRSDRVRLEVTPGITCLWQVSGRSEIPFEKQVEMDITYIERRSLWFDLVLLAKTIPAVIKARGAC